MCHLCYKIEKDEYLVKMLTKQIQNANISLVPFQCNYSVMYNFKFKSYAMRSIKALNK